TRRRGLGEAGGRGGQSGAGDGQALREPGARARVPRQEGRYAGPAGLPCAARARAADLTREARGDGYAHRQDDRRAGDLREVLEGGNVGVTSSFMTSDRTLFTSESVTEGHPDKLCDQISDGMLDECLRQDPNARVACETATTTGTLLVCGEMSTTAWVGVPALVRP